MNLTEGWGKVKSSEQKFFFPYRKECTMLRLRPAAEVGDTGGRLFLVDAVAAGLCLTRARFFAATAPSLDFCTPARPARALCFGSTGPTMIWDGGAAGAAESPLPASLSRTSEGAGSGSGQSTKAASLRDGGGSVGPRCRAARTVNEEEEEASSAVVVGGAQGHRHGRIQPKKQSVPTA